MSQSYVKRDWLWQAKTFASRNKIIAIKMLSGTLPTNINRNRGDDDQRKKFCSHEKAETYLHVLNECTKTHHARSKRHNLVVNKIGKELKKIDYTVWLEKTFVVNQQRYKPDITAYKDGCCNFIEITCPYEMLQREAKRR